MRSWTTEDGTLFVDMNGSRSYFSLKDAGFGIIADIVPDAALAKPVSQPNFLLTETSLEASIGFGTSFQPPWSDAVKDATVAKVTDESVTFLTRDHGRLTIRRDTGMLQRQAFDTIDDGGRILEMTACRASPGKAAIIDITSKWEIDGAKPAANKTAMEPMMLKLFQSLIDGVEHAARDAADLEKILDKARPGLKKLARLSLENHPASNWATIDWGDLVDSIHKEFFKQAIDNGKTDEELQAFIMKPESRQTMLDFSVKAFWKSGSKTIEPLFFGDGRLISAGPTGNAAKLAIDRALLRAVMEIKFMPALEKKWGEAKNPE
jgi:hypothetical protein